jgi:exopolysaccharide biosynthesis protein
VEARSLAQLLLSVTAAFLTACGGDSAQPRNGEAPRPVAQACSEAWEPLAAGIEQRCTRELHLVRIDPRRARIDAVVRPGSTAQQVAASGWTFAMNANFFDEQYRPLGVVVSGGAQVSAAHPVSWQAVFVVTRRGKASIVRAADWKMRDDIAAAAQAGPRLVIGGKENQVARATPDARAGVCVAADGRVLFFATRNDVLLDVWQTADLTLTLGCRDAMLFDGGPSVQLKAGEVSIEGDKHVPAYVVGKANDER